MGIYLTFTAFGVFLLNEDSKVLAEQITYPDVDASADNVRKISGGTPSETLQKVLEQVKDYPELEVADSRLAKALSQISDISVQVNPSSKVIKWFLSQHDTQILERKVSQSSSDIQKFRNQVGLILAKFTVSEAGEEKDPSIKHAIDSVGEIDKSINIVAMRLREWYSLHFPILTELLEGHEEYTRVVNISGRKSNMTREKLLEAQLSESSITLIEDAVANLLGSDLSDADMSAIDTLSEVILNLYKQRRVLEAYVTTLMEEAAPNITSLVGPLVGARLLSLAGSLKELARKPSSTLQILGAEKALFRSLKTGTDPPKHGVIFQVPEIHSAPYWQRGKIARALAGKLSIAARIDAYSDVKVVGTLREQFEARLAEIQRQHPEAPPPKPPKPKQPSRPQRKQWQQGRGPPRGRQGDRQGGRQGGRRR
ncbi:MAG: C/D box methylation guide ribonucleoprotein complex aNOP56 subunit [Candidatus Thorarchaeota archaeon]|nr:C/D box methylation guide ribonucleoprotein complex aNOP56 subunit [Candidatus Thorarchaeota archaeon]